MKRLAGFFAGMVGLALAVSSGGALAATECNGVITGTVVGGVVVNAGDFCVLGGANISGGVQVNTGIESSVGGRLKGTHEGLRFGVVRGSQKHGRAHPML